jgi:hypothetical protein
MTAYDHSGVPFLPACLQNMNKCSASIVFRDLDKNGIAATKKFMMAVIR